MSEEEEEERLSVEELQLWESIVSSGAGAGNGSRSLANSHSPGTAVTATAVNTLHIIRHSSTHTSGHSVSYFLVQQLLIPMSCLTMAM